MIAAFQKDEAFLADVRCTAGSPEALHLWWLGQSGFLVKWQDQCLLFDPYLSDSLTRKYAQTDKPHVRLTERVIAPERLDFLAVATSSHNHTDHLDAETLRPLLEVNPHLALVVPEANRGFVAERLQVPGKTLYGLAAGETVRLPGFEITAVPAAHETLEIDAAGRHRFLGYIVRAGSWTVYHSGDTVCYPGMEENLRPFKVDAALLPINGRAPERRVAGNLWGREAAELARSIGAGLAIPCHFEMFAFNTASPDEFVAACRRIGQPFAVLRAGERRSLGLRG